MVVCITGLYAIEKSKWNWTWMWQEINFDWQRVFFAWSKLTQKDFDQVNCPLKYYSI